MSRLIYADECGFTGSDLMNPDQPVFVFASHNFTEDEAVAILDAHCAAFSGPEIKHEKLSKNLRGQNMVLAVLADPRVTPDRLAIGIAHKQFATLLKIIDLVVETVMHEDGVDLYDGAGNSALGNMWQAVFGLDRGLLTRICRTFQDLVRRPSPETLRAFEVVLRSAHPIEMIRAELSHLRASTARLMQVSPGTVPTFHGRDLDLAIAIALPTMHRWRERGGPGFELVHDDSSHMARQHDVWQWLVSPTAPEAKVGGAGWSATYPIGVTKTSFARSTSSRALQLADLIAGATARFWRGQITGGKDDQYYQRLRKDWFERLTGEDFSAIFAVLLWPTPDVDRKVTEPGAMSPFEYDQKRAEADPRPEQKRHKAGSSDP